MIEQKLNKQSEHKGLGPAHYTQKKLNNKLIKIKEQII